MESIVEVTVDENVDQVQITALGGGTLVYMFFHRIRGKISNTTVVLESTCSFQDVVPTVMFTTIRPALVKKS